MPPKRKVVASTRGAGPTKRLASNAATPQPHIGSSDEYTEDGEYAAGSEAEGPAPLEERRRVSNLKSAIKALSADSLKRGGKGPSHDATNNLSDLRLKPDVGLGPLVTLFRITHKLLLQRHVLRRNAYQERNC